MILLAFATLKSIPGSDVRRLCGELPEMGSRHLTEGSLFSLTLSRMYEKDAWIVHRVQLLYTVDLAFIISCFVQYKNILKLGNKSNYYLGKYLFAPMPVHPH